MWYRNPHGVALYEQGELWTAEHGAKGGDEVYLIRKSANFGWPVINYCVYCFGVSIGEGSEKGGMKQPAHYWDPSIAPSGLVIHQGQIFGAWNGNLLVRSLKFEYISRLSQTNDEMEEVEKLSSAETSRVREVQTALDCSIWFLSAGHFVLYRNSQE